MSRKMMRYKTNIKGFWVIAVILVTVFLGGCTLGEQQVMDGDGMFQIFEYKQISQDEAKQMMEKDDGHVIVDVRREDEYAEGHIPGAILIPNESIENEPPLELQDPGQIILIYCRSGRRSKEAAKKLADMGYSNVYEFGGIIDWTGDIVIDEEIRKADFPELSAQSRTSSPLPSVGGSDEQTSAENDQENMTPNAFVTIKVVDRVFSVDLAGNSSADAFFEKLKDGDIEVEMHDYGNFEKVGDLPWELPTNDEEITAKPGDLILYQGNKITVYYDENTWKFTKLGSLNGSPEEIKEVFGGEENITAEFFLEWTE